MSRSSIVQRIVADGAVAVIRADNPDKLKHIIDALRKGGMSAIEVTMTVPRALEIIEATARSLGDEIVLGVGSVLDAMTARMAINAGARYVVCPVFKPEIVETAHRYDLPVMPGCFTPTEILAAHEAGADVVKVFPADILGMPFFKAVKAPMPHLQMMPTGGVTLTNAGDWLKAGACAVGIGSALLDSKAIAEGRYSVLTENARILLDTIAASRSATSD
ncbi:MAG: bifunctional 4-hydroxy-2-oxoglutarate aldolase/2-dehydro-3-deoxy-phosphogluconate aldolase [Rhodothermales bacterium]|nr:bifunctional 4-hydroxy-2-oxoglutarate aldolase/2-dehydro-3-deoxy-phosphogluconate aldolase [Rhodothermales bacterium]